MGEWPNRPHSGSGRGPCCRSVVAFTASTARFRKRNAGLECGTLRLAVLEDFETPPRPLGGSDRRVDDVSTPSALPNPEMGRLDVTSTGGRGNLGSFARLSFMIRVADSPRDSCEGGKFALCLLHLSPYRSLRGTVFRKAVTQDGARDSREDRRRT